MSDDFVFYANNVNIFTSVYDVTLNFSIRVPTEFDSEAGVVTSTEDTQLVRVRMSPQHAKSLTAVLIKHIKNYEEDQGIELPIPDNMKLLWDQFVIHPEEA